MCNPGNASITHVCTGKTCRFGGPNVVNVNTLSLLVGTGSLFYERKLSDNLSGQMGVGYLSYKIEDSKFSGLILTPEVRFYPKSNAIDGFYLAPYFRYQNFKLENTETNDKEPMQITVVV
ncbi:DUF3575 domain-containing protein [Tenuifilum osseticum]|uniref:DUF3575 domain-containing protein n=1 Tax=Tenuifilum osseticum TaxID=3374723 RepID=UPI0034E46790